MADDDPLRFPPLVKTTSCGRFTVSIVPAGDVDITVPVIELVRSLQELATILNGAAEAAARLAMFTIEIHTAPPPDTRDRERVQ
jgi:hypothetical protein